MIPPGAWPLPDADALRDRLLAAYADPGRGYHDTRHLAEVLARLDELAAHGERFERRPVVLAAWFHDAVYDGRPGAEERSARWAAEALAGAAPDLLPEVVRLVRLTEHHRPRAGDADGAALCDADLAVLAAEPERYAAYTAGIRREYAHVPDDAFRAGRAAVLRGLLARDRLFSTGHARRCWEEQARRNAGEELRRLAEG